MKNRNHIFTTLLVEIACFALLPIGQAVVPPPDGGYPGGNTAEGQAALLSQTTGGFNAAIGWLSLRGLTTGSFNTGVGAGTLALNNADQNTAIGAGALLSNTTGVGNTATGAFALFSNTASGNTANGAAALFSNTTGGNNTATGLNALFSNAGGNQNTADGDSALEDNITGNNNTAIGFEALRFGTGSFNTAVGSGALQFSTGDSNTAVGHHALINNTSGTGNLALGDSAGSNVSTASNVICIRAPGQDVNNSCYIGFIFGATSPGGTGVFVNSDGKLGTTVSSRRFKDDIKPMNKASEAILALQPVTFRYKEEFDLTGAAQFGLVAEEVERVNPDLVVHDKDGKPYSVRYDQVNAMLLNEFLKEHKRVAELEAALAQQQKGFAEQDKRIEALTSGLQKISAQLEVSRPAPHLAANKTDQQKETKKTKEM